VRAGTPTRAARAGTARRRTASALARGVAFAWLVVILGGTALAWTPQDFATYCGRAAYDVADDDGLTRATWYAAQSGDPDVSSGPGCAALEQRGWLEDALPEALRRLQAEPFPVSPTPTRLGPVLARHTGSLAVRVFVNDNPGIAYTFGCSPAVRDGLGILNFNGERLDGMSLVSVPYVAAHELVHVLQEAQPLVQGADCTRSGRLPLWVSEGTADAFATLWIREQFPALRPPAATGLGRNLLGLRSFSVALAAPDGDESRTQLYSYRSSALFRFVAERWHAGDHAIWARSMASAAPRRNDGLAWLDARLRDPALGVEQPLALVFPSFLASYAGWGRSDGDRWPHVGEAAWRRIAFGDCERIVLNPASPAVTRDLVLEPLAGVCVEVRVEGVAAGRIASVEVAARSAELDEVDVLHLSGVSMGLPPLDGGPSTCVEAERIAPLAQPACVAKAITARRTDASGAVTWARTFQAASVRSQGAPWTDVVIVSRVPDAPTDAKDAHRRGHRYPVTFALQFAEATADGRDVGPVQAAANLRAPGHTGLATLPGEGDGGGAFDPSRMLFGQQAPGGLAVPSAVAEQVPGAGIFVVQLMEGDDLDGDDIGRSFSLSLGERPIPPRATGTFPGAFSGTDLRRPGLGSAIVDAGDPSGDGPSGRVTVLGWDADHVQLRLEASWCHADELREGEGCRVRRPFAADIWLPFGDAYDVDHPYLSVDSPVQALYREAFARAVGFGAGFAIPALPPGPPAVPGPAPAPPAASDGVAFACDCSCDGMAAFERRAEEIARSGSVTPATVAAVTQCAMTCAPRWAQCED
jgi:hypothetical protein